MNVILFGATGMVGQGVLRECMLDPEVAGILCVGRSAPSQQDSKLRSLVRADLLDFSAVENQLMGFDACFFCLGVTSVGASELDYRRITLDVTVAAAETLVRLNPGMTFIYVSALGVDSTGRSHVMWARVKGAAENAILALPFKAACVFRLATIVPMHGIQSRTKLYRYAYVVLAPVLPWMFAHFPKYVTTTEQIGRAMLKIAKTRPPKPILENADINVV